MLRKLFAQFVSSVPTTISARPWPKPASASTAVFVDGSSYAAGSQMASEPRCAWTESAARSAFLRALRLTLTTYERGLGPKATPPPYLWDTDSGPERARPVPFWRNAFAPVIATSPRVSVDAEPWRCAFNSARAVSCTSAMWNSWPKTASSRSTLPCFPM